MGLATMAQHRQQAAAFKEEPSPDSVSFYFAFMSKPNLGIPNQVHESAHATLSSYIGFSLRAYRQSVVPNCNQPMAAVEMADW